LASLLDRDSRGGHAILNALQNPLPYSNIATPTGWLCVGYYSSFPALVDIHTPYSNYATHERVANHTRAVPGLPLPTMPWEDLRWIIFATRDAKSAAHQDVLSTVITILCGWKIWAIGVPLESAHGKSGDFSSRRGFHGFDSRKSNTVFLQWEFILLGPNMTL
jgi:hypothetical protein